jgi:hypothetical protein
MLCPTPGTISCVRGPVKRCACRAAGAGGRTPSSVPSKVTVGTVIGGCAARRRSSSAYAGSPGTRPKRCRYEWITTSTKSGLSNAAALRSKVASSKRQPGDQVRHSSRHSARRSRCRPARPRSPWK